MMFDEIKRLYNCLEKDGTDGEMRKVFLSLNGGDPWTVSTKTNGTGIIEKTHLNYTGMHIFHTKIVIIITVLSPLSASPPTTVY